MKIRAKVLGTLLAATPLAHAADEADKGYVMPLGGYTLADSDREVDDDLYYGLAMGKHVNRRWSLELNASRGEYDRLSGGKLSLTTVSADALFVFNRAGAVSPFVSAGAGYIENSLTGGETRRDLLGQMGLGLMLDVAESSNGSFVLQLRPEAKARWDGSELGTSGHAIDYLGGLSLVFAFGPERVAPAVVPVAISARLLEPTVAIETPPPPEPPAPPEAIVLEGVHFAIDSAEITAVSFRVLEHLAQQLKRNPRLKIELQGHTDANGDDAYNLHLSQRRADAVQNYLIALGVAADRLSAKGYGETRPIANNGTREGRLANRRVAMAVLANPENVRIETAKR